jgi:hypothetical protein
MMSADRSDRRWALIFLISVVRLDIPADRGRPVWELGPARETVTTTEKERAVGRLPGRGREPRELNVTWHPPWEAAARLAASQDSTSMRGLDRDAPGFRLGLPGHGDGDLQNAFVVSGGDLVNVGTRGQSDRPAQ